MFALHLNKTREYLPVSQNRSVVTIKAPTKKNKIQLFHSFETQNPEVILPSKISQNDTYKCYILNNTLQLILTRFLKF